MLTNIRDILALTAPLGSYQSGTDYVPETGLYKLHKGEWVGAANDSHYNGGGNVISFNVNISGNDSPQETGKAVRKEMEAFMQSGVGRKLVQSTARGH